MGFPTIYILPDDTLLWIDAPESARAAQDCIDAFRAIPAIGNKPIVALIYTIFHFDHTWGAGVSIISLYYCALLLFARFYSVTSGLQ